MTAPANPPRTRPEQIRRLLKQAALVLVIFGVWLFIGMLGYHVLDGCNWVDSFSYAALLIADEGPSYPQKTDEAKIFVGVYSLCNIVIFLTTISVVVGPTLQKGLRHFQARAEENHPKE